jgi:hypothetical protein
VAYGLAVGSSWNQSRGDAMWQTTCQLKLNIRRVAGGFGHLLPFPPATVSFDMFTKAYKTPDKGSKGHEKKYTSGESNVRVSRPAGGCEI